MATLAYAYKASSITNKLVRNDDPGIGLISKMKKQIQELESELKKANKHIEVLSSLLEGKVKSGQSEVQEQKPDDQFFDKIYSKIDVIKANNQRSMTGSTGLPSLKSSRGLSNEVSFFLSHLFRCSPKDFLKL